MDRPGSYGRHRDQDGEISRKHGKTRIRTLRKVYGRGFAEGFPDEDLLDDALATMDGRSLRRLAHDHERGLLGRKIASATCVFRT